MPTCLTEALKRILQKTNLDKVYEVIAIPLDCNNRQDTKKYPRENYDYSIAGTLIANRDGSLKAILNIFKQSDPVLDIPPFEHTGQSSVYTQLATFIIEKLPSITKGGQ
jgi:hypothetical protein